MVNEGSFELHVLVCEVLFPCYCWRYLKQSSLQNKKPTHSSTPIRLDFHLFMYYCFILFVPTVFSYSEIRPPLPSTIAQFTFSTSRIYLLIFSLCVLLQISWLHCCTHFAFRLMLNFILHLVTAPLYSLVQYQTITYFFFILY